MQVRTFEEALAIECTVMLSNCRHAMSIVGVLMECAQR